MENVYELQQNTSDDTSDSEDYSGDESSGNENEDNGLNNSFLNDVKKTDYITNRNRFFTKDVEKRIIVIDSHNLDKGGSFNSSNFDIIFDFEKVNLSSNYTVYDNVIGFKLLRANIRSPPFNINSTNNIIYYTLSGETEKTLTINPGLYSLKGLADVFQLFTTTNSHYISDNVFTATFYDTPDIDSGITNDGRGFRFKISHVCSEFTINWGKNNISKGAARTFGFTPVEITSISNDIYSDKIPDISTHYVDLIIPEIPPKACKSNSYGKDIIERIPLDAFHGEYVHYSNDDHSSENYFFPIKLFKMNIRLFSQDKNLYDCNNADNFFEFEVTVVNNVNLLK